MKALAVSFLLLCLMGGCLAKPGLPVVAPPSADARATVLGVLGNISAPVFSPVHAVDAWESFVNTYPKRDYLTPMNPEAAGFLQSRLEAAGYQVDVLLLPFENGVGGASLPTEVRVVRGTLEGRDATHRMALVAHYDGETATTQAAYDDAAGTIAQLSICEILAQQKARLNHTIDCLFFDAEEMGLVASQSYVKNVYQKQQEFVYDMVFGYDMTGINWPGHEWNLWAYIGTQKATQDHLVSPASDFLNVTLHEFFDGVIPGASQGIQIAAPNPRNSDEQSFSKIGIPAVRFAGGKLAADYPHYHRPTDTIPLVYEFVGGRANFEKGYDAVIRASYYTILGFDAFDVKALPTA